MEFFDKKYSSYEEFQNQFSQYQADTFQSYTVRSSVAINEHDPLSKVFKSSKIVYVCKHGLKPRTQPKDNSRPNQHSYFTNCHCNITFKYHKKEEAFVTAHHTVEGHNHEVSKEAYLSYTHVNSEPVKICSFIASE